MVKSASTGVQQSGAAVRADHPVFAAFLASGRLTLTLGDQSQTVEIDRANLSKLRRFAELCTG